MASSNGNGKHVEETSNQERFAIIENQAGAVFCKFRLDHIRYLKGNGNATVVLAYIINTFNINAQKTKDRKRLIKNDFWIRLPANQIQTHLGMSQECQLTAIRKIESVGLIELDRRAGNTLWVRLAFDALQKLERADSRNRESRYQKPGKPVSETGKAGIPYKTNSKTNRKGGPEVPRSPPSCSNSNGHTNGHILAKPSSQIDPLHIANAKKLRSALRSNNRQVEGAIRNWPDYLRLLQDQDGQHYQPALDFYCLHCSWEELDKLKLPSINSAKQFRKQFDWIYRVYRKHRGDEEVQAYKWVDTRNANGTITSRRVPR